VATTPALTYYWGVVPSGASRRVYAVPRSGSPGSGVFGNASSTEAYSSISSTTWEQMDVAPTGASTFIMALTDNGPFVRYSNDSGASAYTLPAGRNMRAIDITPSASTIVAGESNADGRAYKSTNPADVTFSLLANSPVGAYYRVAMSDDGSVIFVAVTNNGDQVHYSADGGSSWTRIGNTTLTSTVGDIQCTPDGTFLMIFSDYIYNFNLTSGVFARDPGAISATPGNFVSGGINADASMRYASGTSHLWLYKSTP
jgi:hypothetical protein